MVDMNDLINFMPRMPSEDELRESALKWEKVTGPCMLGNWPDDLAALSMPTQYVELPRNNDALYESSEFVTHASPIAAEIDAITGFDRVFFRLNSRSPKDSAWPMEIPVTCSGKEMMNVIGSSERCLEDLGRMQYTITTPKICLREYQPGMQPIFEYRVFIKGMKILAVAEYANKNSLDLYQASIDFDAELRQEIDKYFAETLAPRLHISTVVIDLWHRKWEKSSPFMLIEINPYGLSDPVGAQNYAAIENGIPSIARLPRESRVADEDLGLYEI